MQYSSDMFPVFVLISTCSKGALLEVENGNLVATQISKYTVVDVGVQCVDMQMFLMF
jgi:hypothetical protein